MPGLNYRFQAGKMNKDLDERLVPNGEYRDALNVQVSSSDGSDIGSLQTIMGNLNLSSETIDPLGDQDFYCVGSITDEKTDRIYWLMSGEGKDIIAEYDYNTKQITPVLVDIFDANIFPSDNSGRVLNFDKSFLITGINIIDDYLFWTDNNTEPKQINITRAKLGTFDFNTHTVLYVKNKDLTNQNPPFIPAGNIKHGDITVIKKSPQTPPNLEMKSTTREDINLDGVAGDIVSSVTFADAAATLWNSNVEPNWWVQGPISIELDDAPDFKNGDYLELIPSGVNLTQSQTTSSIIVEIRSTVDFTTNPGKAIFDIEIVSGNVVLGDFNSFEVRLRQDIGLFKFKFPRFAYRYKYEDGQYSTFSPFSEVAFLPSEFDYMPKEGYNLGMVNNVRFLAVKDFVDTKQIPDEVVAIDILYKESNSPIVYSVETIEKVNPQVGVYDRWNAINTIDTTLSSSFPYTTTGFLNITSEVIHAALPSNQLLRGWDNVPRKALAQEMVGNRLVYGNYLQNYNMENSRDVFASAFEPYPDKHLLLKNNNITVDLKLAHIARPVENELPELFWPHTTYTYNPAKSIKSLRTYQVGVVYLDEFGRQTPVFTASTESRNSLRVEKDAANKAGQLKAQIHNIVPEWAKGVKFLIKESSNEYYNLAMDRWYDAEDGNIWLSFSSSERNKVDEETFLILKKQHDSDIFVNDTSRYKILAIENEAPLFVKTYRAPKGKVEDGLTSVAGSYIIGGSTANSIGFPYPTARFINLEKAATSPLIERILEDGTTGYELRVISANGVSKFYEIKDITEASGWYTVRTKKAFGEDMQITSTVNWTSTPLQAMIAADHAMDLEFVKKEVKNKPEFDGRFFVKVLRDASIKENIIGPEGGFSTNWQVTNSIISQYINPQYNIGPPLNSVSYGGFNNSQDWYGLGSPDMISISSHDNNVDFMHGVHANPGGQGQTYWNKAGNTPNNNSQSSGWFIDKVEGFRNFKYTKHFFPEPRGSRPADNNDPNWNTNEEIGPSFLGINHFKDVVFGGGITGPHYVQMSPKHQMQIVGTNTFKNSGNNNYLGQSSLKNPGNALENDTSNVGEIVPSKGIEVLSDGSILVHLSHTGVNDGGGGSSKSFNGNLSTIRNHFSHTDWGTTYVLEEAFIISISTPSTLWRWFEDPDHIVYRTLGNDASITGQTDPVWMKNTWDAIETTNVGVRLFNYTKFQDYAVERYHRYKGQNLANKTVTRGTDVVPCFVSQAAPDTEAHFGPAAAAFTAWSLAQLTPLALGASMAYDGITYRTSGGWNGVGYSSGQHNRYPMFTRDQDVARNKRRRFQFRAVPFQYGKGDKNGQPIDMTVNSAGDIDGTSNYLPTNDPNTLPHFLDDGTVLTSSTTPSVPSTSAPGIRPDGMYSGYDINGTAIPGIKTTDSTSTNISMAPGSVTWQILEKYYEIDDGEDLFTSTNPAIWETEPKEDLDLELYHEVGRIYPTELNESTMEQFIGPIRDDIYLNPKVSCWDPSAGWITLNTGSGAAGSSDIRVEGYGSVANGDERFVYLADVNYTPLQEDPLNTIVSSPTVGSRLLFTREDGSRVECAIEDIPISGSNGYQLYEDLHNYEVVLPWHNCYSFGNGVESNRIRDDYNQVFIDKGAKVSTVLEEPYAEDRRGSGLIYSGIYNSLSDVNNLNQFIAAEKITKDLNPDGGTIQKLYTRDTNLVTLCEDKVFKILANKDAVYNADGNPQLVATDRVLGQATTFAGDYGISTNPESFAVESFRMYFADRTRGAILRLSQDGLTPISNIGMRDWFNDNLVFSNRLIGSYDEKKKEYNLSLSYYNFDSYIVRIVANSRDTSPPYSFSPIARLLVSHIVANSMSIGDEIIGVGIPSGTTIIDKINLGGGSYRIDLNQSPTSLDVAVLGNATIDSISITGDATGSWTTRVNSISETKPENTLSFSEPSKGWVSFKSFQQENGVSLNNEYYTFKGGQLYQHHANETRNEFYGDQYDSSVEVLFNEAPGSVKSFNTLNYEGSQSHITKDVEHSGEYWDNKDKLGWYVSDIYTNLQEGDTHEFKDKEGKWFSQIKGVTTEWLNDGTAGNIDTREFSYQGIDDSNGVTVISGDYTTWDCQHGSANGCCTDSSGVNLPTHPTAQFTVSSPTSLHNQFFEWFWNNPSVNFRDWNYSVVDTSSNQTYLVAGCFGGTTNILDANIYPNNNSNWIGLSQSLTNFSEVSVFAGSASQIPTGNPSQTAVMGGNNVNEIVQWCIDHIDSGAFYLGMSWGDWNSVLAPPFLSSGIPISTPNPCGSLSYNCIEVQGSSGAYTTESACLNDTNAPCGDPCSQSTFSGGIATAASSDAVDSNCSNGFVYVDVVMGVNVTSWNVVYEETSTGVVTPDTTVYNYTGSSNQTVLPPGDYSATITDSNGCSITENFIITCTPTPVSCSPTNPHIMNIAAVDMQPTPSGSCVPTQQYMNGGSIDVQMIGFGNAAVSWSIDWYIDQGQGMTWFHGTGPHPVGHIAYLTGLEDTDYEVKITDSLGCEWIYPITIDCIPPTSPTYACTGDGNSFDHTTGQTIPQYTCYDPIAAGYSTPGMYTDATAAQNGFADALAECQASCISPCAALTQFTVQTNQPNWECSNAFVNWSVTIPNFQPGDTWTWLISDASGAAIISANSPQGISPSVFTQTQASGGFNIATSYLWTNGNYNIEITHSSLITSGPHPTTQVCTHTIPFTIVCDPGSSNNYLCHQFHGCSSTTQPLTDPNVYPSLAACQAACGNIYTPCTNSITPHIAPISTYNHYSTTSIGGDGLNAAFVSGMPASQTAWQGFSFDDAFQITQNANYPTSAISPYINSNGNLEFGANRIMTNYETTEVISAIYLDVTHLAVATLGRYYMEVVVESVKDHNGNPSDYLYNANAGTGNNALLVSNYSYSTNYMQPPQTIIPLVSDYADVFGLEFWNDTTGVYPQTRQIFFDVPPVSNIAPGEKVILQIASHMPNYVVTPGTSNEVNTAVIEISKICITTSMSA